MGFFSKISKSDTLTQALAKKELQSDISIKTVTKLTEKIKNASQRQQWDAYTNTKLIKHEVTRDKILSTFHNALREPSQRTISDGLANNLQHDTEINFIDEMYLPQIIESINAKRAGFNLRYFDDLNSLFNTAFNRGLGACAQAVVRMKRKGDKSQIHYAALDYVNEQGIHYFMFFEPATLSGNPDAGADYGYDQLKYLCEQYRKKHYDKMRVSFSEMGIQSSPADCGMFSLSLANTIAKRPVARNHMIKSMEPFKIINFYQKSVGARVKFTSRKTALLFPESYLKHSNSISILKSLDTTRVVNKKGETLLQRAERHRVSRDGASYSNSIEEKRGYFFRKHVLGGESS